MILEELSYRNEWSFHAVLTDVECEFSYNISLMEALKSIEMDGDYVIAIIKKSEMGDDNFLAGLPFTLQVSGSRK